MIVTLNRSKDNVGEVALKMWSGSFAGPQDVYIEKNKRLFNSGDFITGVDDILILGRDSSEDWKTQFEQYSPRVYKVLAQIHKNPSGTLNGTKQITIDSSSLNAPSFCG